MTELTTHDILRELAYERDDAARTPAAPITDYIRTDALWPRIDDPFHERHVSGMLDARLASRRVRRR